ncbi:SDR family NAD(P)-dependent oxidoreductase [Thalassotalea psychrophila]|uniref:SDR family NAD(P)-dependent oxidoreductase n=1 Tax=Thalassotalea psychrophila TaxID=3065647 RepID=A0ABY9U0L3_9GAMM|nr:SDR family NAD(P)-dependent oxidoreductase [Colwelliaceae bacterium SQ149]
MAIDVQDRNYIENAFQVTSVLGEYGLTAVINCNGIALLMPCETITTKEVQAVINTNLIGTFLTSQESLPFLRLAKGTLINIASYGGYLTMPFGYAYCAGKFGVEALSNSLRVEVKPQGINVVIGVFYLKNLS